MRVCKHVFYSGQVQGVGFRWTARNLAQGFPVTGFVRNLNDGRVEIVVEGWEADVQAFLRAIADRMAGYIVETDAQEDAVRGFEGFEIR